MQRRVVVTGLGMLSPLGLDVRSTWDGLMTGRSGAGPITHFDASDYSVQIACELKGFDATQWMSPKDLKKYDVFVHYAVAAAEMALADSGLQVSPENEDRIGVVIGFWHRWFAVDRADPQDTARERAATGVAVLHPWCDHQHVFRPDQHPDWSERPELRYVHGVLDFGARHRRCVHVHSKRARGCHSRGVVPRQ